MCQKIQHFITKDQVAVINLFMCIYLKDGTNHSNNYSSVGVFSGFSLVFIFRVTIFKLLVLVKNISPDPKYQLIKWLLWVNQLAVSLREWAPLMLFKDTSLHWKSLDWLPFKPAAWYASRQWGEKGSIMKVKAHKDISTAAHHPWNFLFKRTCLFVLISWQSSLNSPATLNTRIIRVLQQNTAFLPEFDTFRKNGRNAKILFVLIKGGNKTE